MTGFGRSGDARDVGFEDPAMLHAALADPRLAWLWLVLRVAVGWFLLNAGWRQLQGLGAVPHVAAIGLTLAGIALILGALVGISAFVGGSLAVLTSASTGPAGLALFAAIVWLVLAWKTAGWIGLDRWLLPLLGMPWRRGALLGGTERDTAEFAGWAFPRRRANESRER
jgi:thiosulfate dehydrogenase (quinone) large subunit